MKYSRKWEGVYGTHRDDNEIHVFKDREYKANYRANVSAVKEGRVL